MSPKTKSQKEKGHSSVIDRAQVRRLAELSRLNLDAGEEERLQGELSSILGYFATVDKVQGGLEHSARRGPNKMRGDEVGPSDPDGVLACAPRKKGRLVRAPRVF